MEVKTFYQLVAKGNLKCFYEMIKIHSKRIFSSQEEAEKYIPQFVINCTTSPSGLYDLILLEENSVKVKVVELEFWEDLTKEQVESERVKEK